MKDTHSVQMLGQLGGDKDGAAIVKFLEDQGVDVGRMVESEFVLKDSDENSIVIVGGKNEAKKNDLSDEWKATIADAEILMLQADMPVEINILAAKYAKAHDCKVILDMGNQTEPL